MDRFYWGVALQAQQDRAMKSAFVDHDRGQVVFRGSGTGFKLLDEKAHCRICRRTVQLCRVGMFRWFHRRCSECLLAAR
jgi:hypothetical protein